MRGFEMNRVVGLRVESRNAKGEGEGKDNEKI